MLSRKAKHLAAAREKTICSTARFFAPFRFAQNDKLLYSLINRRVTITNAIVSVSLSNNFPQQNKRNSRQNPLKSAAHRRVKSERCSEKKRSSHSIAALAIRYKVSLNPNGILPLCSWQARIEVLSAVMGRELFFVLKQIRLQRTTSHPVEP